MPLGTETEGPGATARDLGFSALDTAYRTWLVSLDGHGDPYEQRTEWQRRVHQIVGRLGDRLITEPGDAAWQGRTITVKNGTEWLNSALAGKWFRSRLDRSLGHPNLPDQQPGASSAPVTETATKVHA